MAARLRRELGTDVDMVHGGYGEFTVLVDGQTVIDGGPLTALGVLPSGTKVVKLVKERLSGTSAVRPDPAKRGAE